MISEPTWNPNQPQVPVDADGNWLNYPDYRCKGWALVGSPWYDEFVIDHMEVGRSSKIIVLRPNLSDRAYPMFIKDLVEFIQNSDLIENGVIKGVWTASKRGKNYGIKVADV